METKSLRMRKQMTWQLVLESFPQPSSAGGIGGSFVWYAGGSCQTDPYPGGELHARIGDTWMTMPLVYLDGAFETYGY